MILALDMVSCTLGIGKVTQMWLLSSANGIAATSAKNAH